MVDIVVHRHQLRETLSRLCSLLMERREIKRRAEPAKPAKDVAAAPLDQPRIVVDNAERRAPASPSDEQKPANDTEASGPISALPPPEKAAAE